MISSLPPTHYLPVYVDPEDNVIDRMTATGWRDQTDGGHRSVHVIVTGDLIPAPVGP